MPARNFRLTRWGNIIKKGVRMAYLAPHLPEDFQFYTAERFAHSVAVLELILGACFFVRVYRLGHVNLAQAAMMADYRSL